MKIGLIFIFLLVAMTTKVSAQWTLQVSGTTDNLYDVFFTSNDTGYVVGANGTIIKTIDGGTNWFSQASGVTGYLHGVTFIDVNTGYSVGEFGVILKTTDGGLNWNPLSSGTTTNLLDVFFTDINNGFAVGWNGVVLKTSDAGANWAISNNGINTSVNLLGVQFTSPNTGYITALSGFLYETSDGGVTWSSQVLSIGSLNLFETHFISPNTGFVVGENSAFLKTIDGGATWTSVIGGGLVLRGVHFVNPNTGYAVGNSLGTGIIRETYDGGTSWSVNFSGGSNQNNVHFPSQTVGYVVGDNGELRKLITQVTGIDTRTECDSLVWIDGNTYTSNNNTASYNIVGGASNGNDSLVTLDLTIINSSSGIDVRTECIPFVWMDGNTYTANNNTATYNIVGGASNGCDSIVTLNLTVVDIDVSTTTSSLTITSNSIGGSFVWLDCDNNFSIIPNETNQNFTATVNGNYAVQITQNGCVDTSSCVVISTVNIPEISNIPKINLFPNPTSNSLVIELNNNLFSKAIIYNYQGRYIKETTKNNLDLSDLPNGVYFVQVVLKSGREIVEKVVKN